MDDLETLLQDFSYLRSLEYRDKLPKRLSKRLYLPDPTCQYVLQHRFKKQPKELDYDRLMRRKPVARKIFQEFVNIRDVPAAEWGLHKPYNDPVAQLLIRFLDVTKALGTAEADEAYGEASGVATNFIDSEVIKRTWQAEDGATVIWGPASPAREDLQKRLMALKEDGERAAQKRKDGADKGHTRVTQLNGFFKKFEVEAHEYLSAEPWTQFLESGHFVRYCQWKQLEINMTVSPADFDVHRILGKGGFGEVHGCRKRDTGKMFAMKKLDKRRLKLKSSEYSAVHERNVLGEMNSKFVVNLKYAFHDADTLYLILDLMEGGDLSFHLKRHDGPFPEDVAMFYAAEITLGLQHIHSRNMVYRDLKPANILLDHDGHCRISDMGLVRDLHRSLPTSECGTRGYMAPEVMQKHHAYGRGADWFSLGCTVLELLTKSRPFAPRGEDGEADALARTLSGEYSWGEYKENISVEGRAFVKALLEVDPDKRLGSRPKGRSDPAAVKAHSWFADVDWLALNDHKIKPKIEPLHGQVNAKEVYEIDRFQANETRGIKVTAEDEQKYYRHFDLVHAQHWQEEVVRLYDMVTAQADKDDAAHALKVKRSSTDPVRDGVLIQGYLLKKSHGMLKGWNRRYIHVFDNRIEVRKEQQSACRRRLPHKETTFDVVSNPHEPKILVLEFENKVYEFKCFFKSDESPWIDCIHRAWEANTARKSKYPPPIRKAHTVSESVRQAPKAVAMPTVAAAAAAAPDGNAAGPHSSRRDSKVSSARPAGRTTQSFYNPSKLGKSDE
mmetsp:Transcript_481/g.1363  ORF Transcript_481/g.1363 Transcript_481/m.1363 type:complete len:783 (-) Transcript_481:511-2859(-)